MKIPSFRVLPVIIFQILLFNNGVTTTVIGLVLKLPIISRRTMMLTTTTTATTGVTLLQQQQQQQQQQVPGNDDSVLTEANYDESLVPSYTLPELMQFQNGTTVQTIQDWDERRIELLNLFRNTMYGNCPENNDYSKTNCIMKWKELDTKSNVALNGIATRREYLLQLTGPSGSIKEWVVLLYTPNNNNNNVNGKSVPVPCFLGLNFAGNHAIHPDEGITYQELVPGEKEQFLCQRGGRARKWQVEKIIKRGFALATVYSGQIEPDNPHTAFQDGVHKLFINDDNTTDPTLSWGTIAAWSWGLSRTLDLLEQIPEVVDSKKVIVIGHSRKGKAALWAAAEDQRFAMAISNNSGCAGAALCKRKYGETFHLMYKRFPTWLCQNNHIQYTDEETIPIDQHELIALIAPRPVYVASASNDKWADPKGEYLSTLYAEPVYKLLGLSGLDRRKQIIINNENNDDDGFPPIDIPIHGPHATMGYHCRTGDHDVLEYDWEQYISFAEQQFGKTNNKKTITFH